MRTAVAAAEPDREQLLGELASVFRQLAAQRLATSVAGRPTIGKVIDWFVDEKGLHMTMLFDLEPPIP